MSASESSIHPTYDLILRDVRVIDPESGRDEIATVGVKDGLIAYIGGDAPPALRVIEGGGRVLSPGFIDLHSHAQTLSGSRLQALDGVTTALELEAGAFSGLKTDERAITEQGRPINFGFSANWGRARLAAIAGADPDEMTFGLGDAQRHPRWDEPLEDDAIGRMLQILGDELDAGAIGIGVVVGFAPESGRHEIFRVAQLAAARRVPVFVHQRYVSEVEPDGSLEGALEVIALAAGTGAHFHLCHLNSTSLADIGPITEALREARRQGATISTETYPYTFSTTSISAKFLNPDRLHRMGIDLDDLTHVRTGEVIGTPERLSRFRDDDPNAFCLVQNYDPAVPEDMAALMTAISFDDAAIASDAIALAHPDDLVDVDNEWPPAPGAFTHPRSAGTFARTLAWLVRDEGIFTLQEALRRATLLPAQILEASVPAMRRKGRVQVGMDADLVLFDPALVEDRATFGEALPSAGFDYVLVGGELIIDDGAIDLSATPGRAVHAAAS